MSSIEQAKLQTCTVDDFSYVSIDNYPYEVILIYNFILLWRFDRFGKASYSSSAKIKRVMIQVYYY